MSIMVDTFGDKARYRHLIQGFSVFHVALFIGVSLTAATLPFYQTLFGYPHGEGGYAIFSHICHQFPTRSFWITGRPFALCGRCTGGYLGVGIGPLLFVVPHIKVFSKWLFSRRFLLGGTLLGVAILDPLLEINGLYSSYTSLRFFSGLIGGLGLFFLLFPMRLSALDYAWSRK